MSPRLTPNRRTPVCDGDALRDRQAEAASVPLDGPEWVTWLRDPAHASFAYRGRLGSFTARREERNGRAYWYAYRKRDGALRKVYLGRAEELTPARLAAAASALRRNNHPTADPAAPDHPSSNLPAALTSFVGRERELGEVRRLLGATRLLTLTGAGGVGKSRLAVEAAAGLREGYRDGVWLVELAALTDPRLVPQAVAVALGVAEQSGRSLTETLVRRLADKRLLLVPDNCEHLLDACAHLAEALLRGCPALRILATSREPLRAAGETAWRVPSLALPDPAIPQLAATLAGVEAARLFGERARAVQPDFAVTDQNAAAVAEICRRLDGIPLAIELAAARASALGVEQIAARLDDQLRLLTRGARTAVPRQQTLRATIGWSHDLLSDDERVVFRRLAVFAGGWTLEAAEAVCAGDGIAGPDVLDLLGRLVDKSLVQAEMLAAGEPRYRLLETVREYAGERLTEADEARAARDRHADWFVALVARAEPAMRGPEQPSWLDRLEREVDNLRAALGWRLDRAAAAGPGAAAAVEAGLTLIGAAWRFWFWRRPQEGWAWLERLLPLGRAPTAARAWALTIGSMMFQGPESQSRRLVEEGVAAYRALGDKAGLAVALIWASGNDRLWGGDYAAGTARAAEALRLAREVGDPWLIAKVLKNEALTADLARPEECARARAAAEEALALLRTVGDPVVTATTYRALGKAARFQGDYAVARAAFAADLALVRGLSDPGGAGMALHGLGSVALAEGDYAAAAAHFLESLVAHRSVGHAGVEGEALEKLAAVAVGQGRPRRAARLLGAAEAAWRRDGQRRRRYEQPTYEATVRAARAGLGDAAFAAAWAAGGSLAPDQAIAEATDETAATVVRRSNPGNLSRREVEVLRLVAAGRSNREIAADLSVSVRTVERHIENLYGKIEARNRADATAYAIRHALA